ncbi:MAG: 1,4-dihydroxy-2-naphthoate octaprenyltransferase [FCB group bacterium]|nr:1,4-dihydroxy-2-naphthoate octaprenyltransferase [FCB group bacterium]
MTIKRFLDLVRAPFFTGVIVPVILGAVIAWHAGYPFLWGYFLLTLLGIVAIHAGANTINDYFDHLSRNDELNTEFVRPFSGGSRAIQNNTIAAKHMLVLSLSLYSVGIVIGIFLAASRGMPIFWIGLAGVGIGVLYVMPVINLAGRGFGELGILVAFGVLCVQGSYVVQAQNMAWEPLLLSLPVGLLITAVLWINEFPDFNADKAVGKHHLVVRLGKQKAVKVYVFLMALTYVLIALFALIYNLWLLLSLIMVPKVYKICRHALANYENTEALIPANAGTIIAHLTTGLLMAAGYVLDRLL